MSTVSALVGEIAASGRLGTKPQSDVMPGGYPDPDVRGTGNVRPWREFPVR
jgi:hypothetical protein